MTSTPHTAESSSGDVAGEPTGHGPAAAPALTQTLRAALEAGTRDAFTAMLTEDVRWGGEERGAEHECTTRTQAGDHYAELRAHGLSMDLRNLQPASSGGDQADQQVFDALIALNSSDADGESSELVVRLTQRGALISDITVLNSPSLEVLFFEGCPHFEAFMPHLRQLVADHGITAPIFLTEIHGEQDARSHRFLGSPSVRVGGHDVDPSTEQAEPSGAVEESKDNARYGMQCRLYATADGGTTGTPQDRWILEALLQDHDH